MGVYNFKVVKSTGSYFDYHCSRFLFIVPYFKGRLSGDVLSHARRGVFIANTGRVIDDN